MKRFLPINLMILLALMSVSNASAEEIEVLGQYFYGEIAIDESHKVRKKINRIPNIPEKTCFGWVINVKPANQLVKITEILKLPAAPKIWDGVEDNSYSQTTTSNDRKTATTKQFMALKSGKLENSWCLSKGDPSGDHHIIVLKEDQILAEFEFVIYD